MRTIIQTDEGQAAREGSIKQCGILEGNSVSSQEDKRGASECQSESTQDQKVICL